MNVQDLLARLDKVRRTGPDTWRASCPAHGSRGPTLAIKDHGGTILLHCHAACSAEDVATAIGVDLSDLFPPGDSEGKPIRSPYPAKAVLEAVAHEAVVVLMIARAVRDGRQPSEDDMKRLLTATVRLNDGLEIVRGNLR